MTRRRLPAPPRGCLIGQRIRAARVARGLTLTDLARRLGITPARLHYVECRATRVYSDYVRDLAQVLDVDTRYLLGLTDDMFERAK